MKKILIFSLLLSFLIFAPSASATIYEWVDNEGVTNFTDNYNKIPPDFRDKAQQMDVAMAAPSAPSQLPGPTPSGTQGTGQAPPIAPTLVREGDLAVKLAAALKLGQPANEAEAENMLTSAGIAPQNGWMADYPVTPDIVGELQDAIGSAADSGTLGMTREQAVGIVQNLVAQQGLPVTPAPEGQYSEEAPPPAAPPSAEGQPYPGGSPPPADYGTYGGYGGYPGYGDYGGYYGGYPGYGDYYYDQGPPVYTYYPPPWDYYYMYSWVPYPFYWGGYFCSGFFILNDFHRCHDCDEHHDHDGDHDHNGDHNQHKNISNHVRDKVTNKVDVVDAVKRRFGKVDYGKYKALDKGLTSRQAAKGAASIVERSKERAKSQNPISAGSNRVAERQAFQNKASNVPRLESKVGVARQMPSPDKAKQARNYWVDRGQGRFNSRYTTSPPGVGSRKMPDGYFNRQGDFRNRSGMGFDGSANRGRTYLGGHANRGSMTYASPSGRASGEFRGGGSSQMRQGSSGGSRSVGGGDGAFGGGGRSFGGGGRAFGGHGR